MSTQQQPEEQLLELLLHLKKTTPEQARTILNAQPQISYALFALMVTMNAVDVDVTQKTLASFSSPSAPVAQSAPIPSALPPHLATSSSQYRTPTPQPQPPIPAPSYPSYPPTNGLYPPQNPVPGSGLQPEAFAAMPEDQRTMILRVLSMTQEEINRLPPADRANVVQLRVTLGLPPS